MKSVCPIRPYRSADITGMNSMASRRVSHPPLRGMNSTYKYYGVAFVIFEFHSFDLQASVVDDL